MLDKPGVAGIGVGAEPAGKPVIEIYKEKADVADLPDELDGVAVESVTTGVIEPRSLPTDRFPRPVPIGVSGGLAGVATGTLGARVTDGTNVYVLSNNHVFAGVNTASIGDPIIQPGDADGGNDPGDRIAHARGLPDDRLQRRHEHDGRRDRADVDRRTSGRRRPPTDTARRARSRRRRSIGQAVQKYGRTTGLQLGNVAATNVSVDVCYIAFGDFCLQEARFAGQISISPGPFSAPGDSGSLVVTQGGNQPVGLLFAGGDGLTIATPIDLVLQRFGVTIDGAPPPNGRPAPRPPSPRLAGDGERRLSWTAPAFDGGSPDHGLQGVSRHEPGPETLPRQRGHVDELRRTRPRLTNGHDLLLQGVRRERQRRRARSRTRPRRRPPTSCHRTSRCRPSTPSTARTRTRCRTRGRWTNGISGSGDRDGSLHHLEHARLLEDDDLHRLAQRRPSTAPTPRSGRRLSTLARRRATRSACYVRLQQPGTRPTTATCCARTSSREPTRSSSSASTTAPSSTA